MLLLFLFFIADVGCLFDCIVPLTVLFVGIACNYFYLDTVLSRGDILRPYRLLFLYLDVDLDLDVSFLIL